MLSSKEPERLRVGPAPKGQARRDNTWRQIEHIVHGAVMSIICSPYCPWCVKIPQILTTSAAFDRFFWCLCGLWFSRIVRIFFKDTPWREVFRACSFKHEYSWLIALYLHLLCTRLQAFRIIFALEFLQEVFKHVDLLGREDFTRVDFIIIIIMWHDLNQIIQIQPKSTVRRAYNLSAGAWHESIAAQIWYVANSVLM